MVARGLTLGAAMLGGLLLVFGGTSPFSTATAAQTYWAGQSVQAKRPQFRPWSRAPSSTPHLRWRPSSVSSERALTSAAAGRGYPVTLDKRMQQPLLTTGRSHARKASPPMPQSDGMGLRFRPDARFGSAGLLVREQRPALSREQRVLHAQFRPKPVRQKKTYEELQAKRARDSSTGSPRHYLSRQYATNAYGRYWTHW